MLVFKYLFFKLQTLTFTAALLYESFDVCSGWSQLVVIAVIHHLHIKSWRIKILCKAGPHIAPCRLPTQWLIYQSGSDITDISGGSGQSLLNISLLLRSWQTGKFTALEKKLSASLGNWRRITVWRNKHLLLPGVRIILIVLFYTFVSFFSCCEDWQGDGGPFQSPILPVQFEYLWSFQDHPRRGELHRRHFSLQWWRSFRPQTCPVHQ